MLVGSLAIGLFSAGSVRAAPISDHKTVLLDVVPTAENLAAIAFRQLDPIYQDHYGNQLRLERIRLYETPNCWADALRSDFVRS